MRVSLGLLALLAVIFVGIGLATRTSVQQFLVDRTDQELSDAGGRYAASLEHPGTGAGGAGGGPSAGADTRAQAPGTFGARLVSGNVTSAGVVDGDADDGLTSSSGQPVGTDDNITLTDREKTVLASLVPDGGPKTVQLSALGEYRVRAFKGADGDVLVTGLPLGHVEQTVNELAEAEIEIFAVAMAVAAVAAIAWVAIALRPLDRVTQTAERVSSLSLASGEVALSVRVPDDDPATEVGRVGASMNRMLGHVEDALAKRHAVEGRLREFAADASHVLRTPVATVRGHAELALRHPESMPEGVRHSLTRIEAESARMGVIVEDLLLLARLDAGRPLVREEVDLTRLALDALDDARAAGPDHRWRLELPEEPASVVGDGHRLAQAIANLLANARTHTPAGTEVTLRLERTFVGEVRLTVTDTGPGLDPELAERAFDRFTRGDRARSRTSGSTGLGLAITRAILEAHGGRVELTSSPGCTAVTLVLPESTEPDEAAGFSGTTGTAHT
jgi:two-component system, OmpR family, sensor kinase